MAKGHRHSLAYLRRKIVRFGMRFSLLIWSAIAGLSSATLVPAPALAEVVWVISHTHDNYLSAQYHRLARRIGKLKAIVAVSHTVAVNFSQMITKRLPYQELGANSFET